MNAPVAPGPGDRYAVIGNPIAHSRSPQIHTSFAQQHQQALTYTRLLAPLDGFIESVRDFAEQGGRGLNVTVPFKEQAFALADHCADRARLAGAANTLSFGPDGIAADNTDGIGLVRDLTLRQGVDLAGANIVLLGAGGAARGVLLPLIQAGVGSVLIANRTHQRALSLVKLFHDAAAQSAIELSACQTSELAVVVRSLARPVWINATAASLNSDVSPVSGQLLAPALIAYDMVYSTQPTAFMKAALTVGCVKVADGLGMLVEQAAESFYIWRGVRPATDTIYRDLR
ncbi:MAG: shikimate dehydrogenase [Burkholderiaceae bacterium]